jgi:pyridoxamine 5'-phosphate oxidase
MSDELWRIRDEYAGSPLDPADCDDDPIVAVKQWLQHAVGAGIATPNAMTLATVDERGRPAARIVLLKEIDARGFVFFTNYDSRKGRELAAHPSAALVLYWEALHRQVRIEGAIEVIAAAESDAYFASRPRGSQLGAIASPQSAVIPDRRVLEERVAELERAHGGGAALARPANWGGYRVVPDAVELWQGQPSRLHDRVSYRLGSQGWSKERLAP